LPAAAGYRERAKNQGALGADLLKWESQLAEHWSKLRFGSATVEHKDGQLFFEVQVFLDDLSPEAVAAELYAEGRNGDAPSRVPLKRGERLVGSENAYSYSARIPSARPVSDYTPRLVAQHPGAILPLEAAYILWHESPAWR
jgi:starch phosphorylase